MHFFKTFFSVLRKKFLKRLPFIDTASQSVPSVCFLSSFLSFPYVALTCNSNIRLVSEFALIEQIDINAIAYEGIGCSSRWNDNTDHL